MAEEYLKRRETAYISFCYAVFHSYSQEAHIKNWIASSTNQCDKEGLESALRQVLHYRRRIKTYIIAFRAKYPEVTAEWEQHASNTHPLV